MMGNGFGAGGMWLFELLTTAGVLLLVLVAFWVFGGGMSRPTPVPVTPANDTRPRRSRAQDLLDDRYDRGEFGTQAHRERLQALQEG